VREPVVDDKAKLAELAALVQKIREDVRARHASPAGDEIPLVNLEPLQRARDAAERQAASIGQVNPRNPGLVNDAIQGLKRLVARSLNWFVRDQISFNHEVIHSLNATVQSLQEANRAMQATLEAAHAQTHAWALRMQAETRRLEEAASEQQAANARRHDQLEQFFEQRLKAELGDQWTAIDHSVRTFEAKTTETARAFEGALAQASDRLQDLIWTEQKKVWDAFAKTRQDYETLIHSELRLARQRAALGGMESAAATASNAVEAPTASLPIDWLKFAEKFRGTEDYVRGTQEIYVQAFQGHAPVVDLGCGRGEFLELMRAAGAQARGVEASAELVAICRSKGLEAECANAFAYLEAAEPGSLGGILCSQMLEHLTPGDVIRLITLAHRALRQGGLLALETPNPECLAIFATHFYLDPSHTRPIPPGLMAFHLEEAGFGAIRIERLHPAVDTMPALAELPADFREAFFGALDYAAFGTKL